MEDEGVSLFSLWADDTLLDRMIKEYITEKVILE
jgi:hypothetical protein